MDRITLPLTAAFLALGLAVAPAQAQLARTFVSAEIGNDTNDCNRLTPCRTFQRAHLQTLDAGEITVLDPGGYGAVTITKNVSIINDGVGEAGVLVSGAGTAITVNAPAGAAVTLRGLTIKGIGFGGGNGIQFNSGAALNIENCTIRNLNGTSVGNGIIIQPGTGTVSLQIANTSITDNSANGILISPSGPTNVNAVLDRVSLYNNVNTGLFVDVNPTIKGGEITVTVNDSIASNNGGSGTGAGILIQNTALILVYAFLNRSVVATNPNHGIHAIGNSTVVFNQSVVWRNALGWTAESFSTMLSYGNNSVDFNGTNQGPLPPVTLK